MTTPQPAAIPGDLDSPKIAPGQRSKVLAWAMWDWGSSAYNTIVVSFVFAPYLTGAVGKNLAAGSLPPETWLSIATTIGALFVIAFAPISGQRADASGHRRRSLLVWTSLTVLSTMGLFFVRDDGVIYFWVGLALLAAGAVFQEYSYVAYNAMLVQISTPGTIGKISGIGWGAGYLGGIVVLLIAFLLFIKPEVGLFGVTDEGGLRYRALALVVVVWYLWSLPTFLSVPEIPPSADIPRVSFFKSYVILVKDVVALYRVDRHAVFFLLSSALFRDGLTAIFTFGGVLAVSVYGLSPADVIIFGVAANVIAAAGAFAAGVVEDRTGAKPVIMVSLIALVAVCVAMLFAHGPTQFWIFGLALCLWVGPAQAASRSYLARLAPEGREGQMFGLYATTGRAVSFLAPALFALFSGIFHAPRAGIVGIAVVLLAGLIALAPVKPPPRRQPHLVTPA